MDLAASPCLDNAGKPSKPFHAYTAENREPSLGVFDQNREGSISA